MPVPRDDPIYVMETDKATTDVESPYTGTLVEWTVKEGSVLTIGTEVARMRVEDEIGANTSEKPQTHGASSASPSVAVPTATSETKSTDGTIDLIIPPRTRKYLKDLNLLDVAHLISASGSKLMPEDVDRYLESRGATSEASTSSSITAPSPESHPVMDLAASNEAVYDDVPLGKQQVTLNYRMARGAAPFLSR